MHGAIGYTEEHDLHLWLLKVRALAAAWGSQAEHRARVMAALPPAAAACDGPGCRRTAGPGAARQRDLRDAVRGLLAPAADPAGRRPDRAGYDLSLWRRLCGEIGVAGLAIPERYGGAGAGPVETHIVMEELGRGLIPSPARLRGAGRAGPARLRRRCGVPAAAARHRQRRRGRGSGLGGAGGHWDPGEPAFAARPGSAGAADLAPGC